MWVTVKLTASRVNDLEPFFVGPNNCIIKGMVPAYINDKGELVIPLLHDSDGTDIVAVGDAMALVDEISGEIEAV